ncbi:MAG: M23 family metallopeptidase [Acidimicrobiia bacterium]
MPDRLSTIVQAALGCCLALVVGVAPAGSAAASEPCEPAEAANPWPLNLTAGGPVLGFPLDDLPALLRPVMTRFCEWSVSLDGGFGGKVHAAEDYLRPPGTPVYAVADGMVSFSGPMGGYGWLIIVDHPESNLYSLYGHLSPSRPTIGTGEVTRGDVIGYLGDDDENGGSADQPLVPHLHFGLRVGQRSDYPGRGEWRWMAGWIQHDPGALGWLTPSRLLSAQQVPREGFRVPPSGFIDKWGEDLIPFGFIAIATIGWVALATVRRSPWPLAYYGIALLIALHLIGAKGPDTAILVF